MRTLLKDYEREKLAPVRKTAAIHARKDARTEPALLGQAASAPLAVEG